jgi:hypothetical protein
MSNLDEVAKFLNQLPEFEYKTKVHRANKDSDKLVGSFKTVIPIQIVEKMRIEDGDYLIWTLLLSTV